MRTANIPLQEIFNEIPQEKREETRLSLLFLTDWTRLCMKRD